MRCLQPGPTEIGRSCQLHIGPNPSFRGLGLGRASVGPVQDRPGYVIPDLIFEDSVLMALVGPE
jgi:hypothetical protein